MAGRPKMKARQVAELELAATALARHVFDAAPAMYRDRGAGIHDAPHALCPGGYERIGDGAGLTYRPLGAELKPFDPVERAWLACLSLSVGLSVELEELGNLLRRKAGINAPGPAAAAPDGTGATDGDDGPVG